MCVWYRPVNDRAAGLSFANDGRRSIAKVKDRDRCASGLVQRTWVPCFYLYHGTMVRVR